MTIVFDAPVTVVPVTADSGLRPLSVQPFQYRAAVAAGAVPVDVRPVAARREHGPLFGAMALDLDEALDLLTPGTPGALRSATEEAEWLLVTDDGYDAEMLAWHLQARGVRGARFVVGGHRALRAAGINGVAEADALHLFDAH